MYRSDRSTSLARKGRARFGQDYLESLAADLGYEVTRHREQHPSYEDGCLWCSDGRSAYWFEDLCKRFGYLPEPILDGLAEAVYRIWKGIRF